MRKRLSILGSTGSIGTNVLEVISSLNDAFEITYLSTYNNVELLFDQVKKYTPKAVVVVDEVAAKKIESAIEALGIDLLTGRAGLIDLSQRSDIDIMLNALVGASGMEPTLNAVKDLPGSTISILSIKIKGYLCGRIFIMSLISNFVFSKKLFIIIFP